MRVALFRFAGYVARLEEMRFGAQVPTPHDDGVMREAEALVEAMGADAPAATSVSRNWRLGVAEAINRRDDQE